MGKRCFVLHRAARSRRRGRSNRKRIEAPLGRAPATLWSSNIERSLPKADGGSASYRHPQMEVGGLLGEGRGSPQALARGSVVVGRIAGVAASGMAPEVRTG